MKKNLLEKARTLAESGYMTNIHKDKTTDGENVFFAYSPELSGCMAQGNTIEEALSNINKSKIDFIYFLLEDNLPIPEPSIRNLNSIEESQTFTIDPFVDSSSFIIYYDFDIEKEPSSREMIYSTE